MRWNPLQRGAALFVFLLTPAVLSGCQPHSTEADLLGQWNLVEATGSLEVSVPSTQPITIFFDGDRASGFSGCNTYNFSYRLNSHNDLTITSGVAQTKKSCPDKTVMAFETAFLSALARTSALEITDETVIFTGRGAELVFKKAE